MPDHPSADHADSIDLFAGPGGWDLAAGRGGQRRSGAGAVGADDRKRSEATAVRVSIEEAGVLQTFPPDYPWQGTKSAQFRQVGNAVPPLLAYRVLEAVGG